MTNNPLINNYLNSLGEMTQDQKERIYKAVLHGLSLVGLKRKPIGCPVLTEAFNFAQSFDNTIVEERFRLQQAVLHGYSIIDQNIIQNIITMSQETTPKSFDDNSIMPFGKFKGKQMANIPAPYFLWLYNEGCSHTGVRLYIQENLEGLKQEAGQVSKKR